MKPFRVFIGYDPAEAVAFHVLCHSIRKHASIPVAITPLSRNNLRHDFTRERSAGESTEFAFSRFLTPYLCDYEGWAAFMDCDMLVREDIAGLASYCSHGNERYGVMCVQHDYTPKSGRKFLGAINEPYPRKNWSSVMLFNNARCRALTPEIVNDATGPYLHRMQWLADSQIGGLPSRWNHLVGEYMPDRSAANYHFTLGGPYFPDYDRGEGADEWWDNFREMTYAQTAGLSAAATEIRALSSGPGRRPFRFNDHIPTTAA